MNNFKEKINNLANKISNYKYLTIIRDSFAVMMPLMIIAAMFVFINSVLLDTNNGLLKLFELSENVKVIIAKISGIGWNIVGGTIKITTLFIAAAIPFNLAKYNKEKDLLTPVIIGIVSTFLFFPATFNVTDGKSNIVTDAFLDKNYLGAAGLFTAVIVTIFATNLFLKLRNKKSLRINMPDSVPPAVGNAFSSLLPAGITIITFSVIAFSINEVTGTSLQEIILKFVQMPLVGSISSFGGFLTMFLLLIIPSLIGIHGDLALGSIITPILTTIMAENSAALAAGKPVVHIFNSAFRNAWMQIGGGGNLIALIIVILLVSKRKDFKMVAKTGLVPSLFNITEPVLFGLPIIFNPIMAIPFILSPVVGMIIGYFATTMNLVSPAVIEVPWTTPPIINAFLATQGDFRAIIVSIVIILVGCLIYLPFVKLSDGIVTKANKSKENDEVNDEVNSLEKETVKNNGEIKIDNISNKKILIMCNAAMSSSMFAKRLNETAKAKNIMVEVEAIALEQMEEKWKDFDVLLVTPQARFKHDYIESVIKGERPIYYIEPEDFGKMRADLVLEKLSK